MLSTDKKSLLRSHLGSMFLPQFLLFNKMCNGFNFERARFHSIFGAFKIRLVEVHKVNKNFTTQAQCICKSGNFFIRHQA